ncbi:hypothetical protein BK826_08055 [Rothia kristinae]|uniref:Helix-turn-helix domain-containing protein n=1 Tax=Rothia kristinae TaxID=37923 RepID=A0A1S2N0F3_9MICC|nr:hypothetical protein BK826_08055 [Rothia kristinae]
MTVDEAAAILRRTPGTLRWWRHVGEGPKSFTLGRRVYYDAEELQAWIETESERTARGGGAA